MEEVRCLRKDEWDQAIALANRVFRDEEQSAMNEAFPYSFSSALSQSIGAFEQGRLVSFMGLVPAVIQVGPAQLDAFLLGQVCTDESARGKGYASRVMDAVLRHIAGSGASLMLVSGARSLYARSGCLPFGTMHKFVLGSDWARGRQDNDAGEGNNASQAVIRERKGQDWFGLRRLADARTVRFQSSLWDLAGMIEAESRASCMKHEHRVLVAERDGALEGFLIYTVPAAGKKTNRKPEAIEWAGQPEVVVELIAHAIVAHSFEAFHLSVPDYDKPLLEQLQNEQAETGAYPATVHIVDPLAMLKQLEPYLQANGRSLPSGYSARKLEDHSVALQAGEEEIKLTAQQFIDWLFAPSADDHAKPFMDGWHGEAGLRVPLPSPHGLLYV